MLDKAPGMILSHLCSRILDNERPMRNEKRPMLKKVPKLAVLWRQNSNVHGKAANQRRIAIKKLAYLMNISHSLFRSLLCLNPATITSVLFAVCVPTLIFTPPKQLPPPSYTPSLTTVTLCTTVFQNIKYQINRLQHIQNSHPRAVVQAPKFQHITPVLKSLQWLKVSERIEYKIISLTHKILNTTISL